MTKVCLTPVFHVNLHHGLALLHVIVNANPGPTMIEEPLNGTLLIISAKEKKLAVVIDLESICPRVTSILFTFYCPKKVILTHLNSTWQGI